MALRLARWAFFVALLVCVSGTLVLVLPEQRPEMLALLDAHVVVGWVLAVLGPAALGVHLARTGSGWRSPGLAFGLGLALSVPAIAALDVHEGTDLFGFLGEMAGRAARGDLDAAFALAPLLSLLVLVVAALVLGVGAQLVPLAAHTRSRWTGSALALLAGWATTTGAVIPFTHRDSLFLAIGAHSVVGCAAVILLAHHLLAARAWRLQTSARRSAVLVLLGTLVVAAGIGVIRRAERGAPAASRLDVPGTMIGRLPATAAERAMAVDPASGWAHLPTSVVRDSMSCGSGGCHPVLTAEWAGSPHRYAASNALYRAAASALVAEGDVAGAQFCAACHDPDRAITGRVATEYAQGVPDGGSDGVSCLACHGMVSVQSDPPANGLFALAAVHADHLGEGERARRRIARDPRAHRHALGIDEFVISPTPCKSCHRMELGADHGAGGAFVLQDQTLDMKLPGNQHVMCQDCHLPVMAREFDQYGHAMPGINADLAAYVTVPEAADALRLEAHMAAARNRSGIVPYGPMTAPGWPVEPELVHPAYADSKETRPLSLRLREEWGPTGALALRVRTFNRRVGHDFPSGPLDLQEVWLEVRVTDGAGRVLVDLGGLDAAHRIVGTPPRLGARELGPDGLPLREHRLKELTAVLDKRVLGIGGFVDDDLPIPLPADTTYPLDVRARWVFRRVNPEFAAFAGLAPGAIPPWEMAAARLAIAGPGAAP